MTNRLTKTCPDCGNFCDRRSERCTACAKRHRKATAIGQHDRCIDCGKLTGDRGHRAKRCTECWIKYRDARPKRMCSVEGCPRLHKAKGYCIEHYQAFLQPRKTGEGRGSSKFNEWVRQQPCQLCGYNRIKSHAHRLIEGAQGGRYEEGNVVALCARCHEEVHRGITPPPPAIRQA